MQRNSSSGELSCRLCYACEDSSARLCSMLYTTGVDALVAKPSFSLPGSILGFAARQMNLYNMGTYIYVYVMEICESRL